MFMATKVKNIHPGGKCLAPPLPDRTNKLETIHSFGWLIGERCSVAAGVNLGIGERGFWWLMEVDWGGGYV
ncbi:unnamed protein product [Cercopithifilaria johnstoni]|uniref:Uncharacterized protein n=1 Tax=Cercopithifilaria johnstoni TaxID=2874296 RepID=A0A8J2QB16_9BILA|nr:unnamed protein product [Cercopithifilaria johnstoni]